MAIFEVLGVGVNYAVVGSGYDRSVVLGGGELMGHLWDTYSRNYTASNKHYQITK